MRNHSDEQQSSRSGKHVKARKHSLIRYFAAFVGVLVVMSIELMIIGLVFLFLGNKLLKAIFP